jgi:hypothetical protein
MPSKKLKKLNKIFKLERSYSFENIFLTSNCLNSVIILTHVWELKRDQKGRIFWGIYSDWRSRFCLLIFSINVVRFTRKS